jgi:hypothetical protein
MEINKEYRVVSEVILEQQGSFKRVRQWLEGHHPETGVLCSGWQGEPQTVRTIDRISPIARVTVYEGSSTEGK